MSKTRERVLALSVPVLAVLCLAVVCALPALAQRVAGQPQVLTNAQVNQPIHFDISIPLREIVAQAQAQEGVHVVQAPLRPKLDQLMAAAQHGTPALSGALPTTGPLISATIGLTFEGAGNNAPINCPAVDGITVAPPDTNAAVGDTQVVQWVNLCFVVFDKATGAVVAGPFPGNHFWAGFGGTCQTANNGDPIIQWDKTNHRWVASQNVFRSPFQTCIAVSQTADATGSYNRYAFPQSGFPDYPKWGLTPTAYYQSQNDFGSGAGFVGVNVCAYDATLMLKGSPRAKQVCILDNSNGTLFDDSMLPADDDSDPRGVKVKPEVLVGSIDNKNPESRVFEYVFNVSFKGKGKASLTGVNGTMPITVPTFHLGCGGFGACIQQPSPGSELLDSLGDRLMYRLARFDDGVNQHFLVTHSVNNSTAVAARWYEFRAPTGSTALSLFQSGETPDDGEFRWMGSAAMDKVGDIALGYSRSSAAAGDFPSIYFSGQTAGDPVGTTETEALIKQGGGSQFNTVSRWGDYSSMALDFADGCTFWYTTEFYPADGSFAWATWLASLKFPNCH
jgi:hypothetical protein